MGFKFVEKTLDEFGVGDSYSFAKTITEADVVLFAGISGDMSPHHVNAQYARTTALGERVAHSMLTASLASAAIGRMTSPGFLTESYEFEVREQVRMGDTITAAATVIDKDAQKGQMTLHIVCTNQDSRVVLEGSSCQVVVEKR